MEQTQVSSWSIEADAEQEDATPLDTWMHLPIELWELVCSHLGVGDFKHLAATCWVHRAIVHQHCSARFNERREGWLVVTGGKLKYQQLRWCTLAKGAITHSAGPHDQKSQKLIQLDGDIRMELKKRGRRKYIFDFLISLRRSGYSERTIRASRQQDTGEWKAAIEKMIRRTKFLHSLQTVPQSAHEIEYDHLAVVPVLSSNDTAC